MNRTKRPPVELKDELTERKVLAYPNAPKPTRVRFQVWDNGDLVMTAHIFQARRCLSSYDHSYITSENAERYMRDFAQICYFAGWFESKNFGSRNN